MGPHHGSILLKNGLDQQKYCQSATYLCLSSIIFVLLNSSASVFNQSWYKSAEFLSTLCRGCLNMTLAVHQHKKYQLCLSYIVHCILGNIHLCCLSGFLEHLLGNKRSGIGHHIVHLVFRVTSGNVKQKLKTI